MINVAFMLGCLRQIVKLFYNFNGKVKNYFPKHFMRNFNNCFYVDIYIKRREAIEYTRQQ